MTSLARSATAASHAVNASSASSSLSRAPASPLPNTARSLPRREAVISPWTKRIGSSRSSSVSQATTAARASDSRRHWPSSEVLPKPAGACTAITALSS